MMLQRLAGDAALRERPVGPASASERRAAEDAVALAAALRRLAGDAALRERLVAGGLETAPRHTEAVLNEAVERELLAASAMTPA